MGRVCSVQDPTKRCGNVTRWRGERLAIGRAEMSGPASTKLEWGLPSGSGRLMSERTEEAGRV